MAIMARRRTWAVEDTVDPRRKLELLLEEGVATLDISVRTLNALEGAGVITMRDLLHTTPSQLLAIENFGGKSLREVYEALVTVGLLDRSMLVKKQRQAANAGQKPANALLTAEQSLERCVAELKIVRDNMAKETPDSPYLSNLQWILFYAEHRTPYGDDTPDEIATAEEEASPVEEEMLEETEVEEEEAGEDALEEVEEDDLEADELDTEEDEEDDAESEDDEESDEDAEEDDA
jgi:hypothetical protein